MRVHLPAGCAMDSRRFAENLLEAMAGKLHLLESPLLVRHRNLVLPQDVIPSMDTNLKTIVARFPHDVCALAPDVGCGQERPA
jgi:hypothetical protein